jgi:hypothetical protein
VVQTSAALVVSFQNPVAQAETRLSEAEVQVKVALLAAPLTEVQVVQTSAALVVSFQNPVAQAATSLLVADVQVKAVPEAALFTAVQAVQAVLPTAP